MKPALKAIWNAVTSILVVLVVLLAVALVGVRLVGYQPFAVLSGSMEPQFSTGDLIYVKDVDYRTLKEGDVITFLLSENTVATHRIVEVVPDENDPSVIRYRTKGDANDAVDGSLVHYMNVIGSPAEFSLPLLGYVASYISAPPGMYVAMGLGALLILLVFLPDILSKEEKEQGRYERVDER